MKKFSIILVIIGILIIASPFAGSLYTQYQENRMLDEWYNSIDAGTVEAAPDTADPQESYKRLQDTFASESSTKATVHESTAEEGSTSAASKDKPKAAAKPAKPVASQVVLGIIKIDKIKAKYPVVEGVKAENLRVGIGHVTGTSGIGQPGNCALAGHRNYTFGRFFNRLDELAVGDEIIVSTKKSDFKYKVYEKLVVKPDDVSVLKGNKDDSILTLITCTPIYIATHRLIIHARLEGQTVKEP